MLETTAVQPGNKPVRLSINVEHVTPEAPLTVELLDSKNRPLAGYSGSEAARISADGIAQEAIWPASGSAVVTAKEPFTVRVILPGNGDARIYAIYVDN